MTREMIHVNWNKSQLKKDINPVLKKYENYLNPAFALALLLAILPPIFVPSGGRG